MSKAQNITDLSYRKSAVKHDQTQLHLVNSPRQVICKDCKYCWQKLSDFNLWSCMVPDPDKINFIDGSSLPKYIRKKFGKNNDIETDYCININKEGKCEDYCPSINKIVADEKERQKALDELESESKSSIEPVKQSWFFIRWACFWLRILGIIKNT
jgi:hypothetical protein